MKIAIIDNYDSFTFNIQHYVEQFAEVCRVINIDRVNLYELEQYDKLIFSPGPGLPKEKPVLWKVLDQFGTKKPILGICFGHQSIAEYFGAKLFNMETVHHGLSKTTQIAEKDVLWKELPKTFKTGRYHSWAVNAETLPNCLSVTAYDKCNKTIMAFRHKDLDIRGVQFHPESILTEYGLQMIKNWVCS